MPLTVSEGNTLNFELRFAEGSVEGLSSHLVESHKQEAASGGRCFIALCQMARNPQHLDAWSSCN